MSSRVAVVQAASAAFDVESSIAKVEEWTARAARDGARLVVFPEAFVAGYPKGADFGVRVGTRSDAGREWFRRYHANAIEVPGPACERLGAAARTHEIVLVVGVIERVRGTLYCSALIFDRDGSLAGAHRKLVPTAMERVIWGRGDGSTMPVVPTDVGAVGVAICWESYMPLYRAALYAKGVEVYCAPTVDDRESWIPTMRHIAVEGRCYVLSACPFARRRDFPADYASSFGDEPETVLIRGGSCIVDPYGRVLAGPAYDEERLLVAEIDRDAIVRARFDLDADGHYARPDVFRLEVDERAQRVEFRTDGEIDPTS